jgi:hypothetical protein
MPKMRKLSVEESARAEQEDRALREQEGAEPRDRQAGTLDDRYPQLSAWVTGGGWIEIGADHYSTSFIRVLDTGGLVWEGADSYSSLDAAFDAADAALAGLEEAGDI